MTFTRTDRYRVVTSQDTHPDIAHVLDIGQEVTWTGRDNADRKGRWPAHCWLFMTKGGTRPGIIQWLRDTDVECVEP